MKISKEMKKSTVYGTIEKHEKEKTNIKIVYFFMNFIILLSASKFTANNGSCNSDI